MTLTEDEVLQILDLVEKSNFDFLELQLGDLKLTVNKSGVPIPGAAASSTAVTVTGESGRISAPSPAPQLSSESPQEKAPEPASQSKPAAAREGTVPVRAPMVGTFYATPEPGAPPFVKLGDAVDEETTVGLVEVMKVFNAVSCGVKGVIEEICIESGQFVEHGQTLFLVRPQ